MQRRNCARRRAAMMMAIAAAAGLPKLAQATVITWNNASGGPFNTVGNWSPSGLGPPGTTDTANFEVATTGTGPTYIVTFASDVKNETVQVRRDDVTFNLGGFTYTQTGPAGINSFVVGVLSGEVGTLSIEDGTVDTSDTPFTGTTPVTSIGEQTGASGTVNLLSGAIWNNTADERVGDSGTGTIVQNAGTQTIGTNATNHYLALGWAGTGTYTLGGTGILTVNGSAYVGGTTNAAGGVGTLNINTGGTMNVAGTLQVWDTAGTSVKLDGGTLSVGTLNTDNDPSLFKWTTGTLTVNTAFLSIDNTANIYGNPLGSAVTLGSGQTLNAPLYVGYGGTGSLTQNSGSTVNGIYFGLGIVSGGNGSYFLNGTGVLSAGQEFIGIRGIGTFTQGGGTNNATAIDIGLGVGSTGTYSLSGTGVVNVPGSGGVYVGGSAPIGGGTGVLNVSGGTMNLGGSLNVYDAAGNIVNLSGGNIITQSLDLGVGDFSPTPALLNWTAGTLTITGSSGFAIGSGGQLGSSLTLSTGQALDVVNILTNTGTLTLSGGSATVGSITGAGTTTIKSGSTLQIALHSPESSQSVLTVSGSGALDIMDNTFVINYGVSNPSPIATIAEYIKTGYSGGTWTGPGIRSSKVASVNASLGNTHAYAIGYANATDAAVAADHFTAGTVVVEPAIVGDANLDGKVNFSDFQLLAASFNFTGTSWDEGNFNYGTGTNFTDFQLLAANFNDSTSLDNAEFDSMNQLALSNGYTMTANPDGTGFTLTAVPEPASLGMVGALTVGILARRRRGARK